MIPKLILVIGGFADGRVEERHYIYHRIGQSRALFPVFDRKKMLHHFLDIAAVFSNYQVLALRIVLDIVNRRLEPERF